jgi:hypothetical protein
LVVNRTIVICALLAWFALWGVLVAAAPWAISDGNRFFKGFVNEQFLQFMGVIVTITLASSANLYIELNKVEDRMGKAVFTNSKRDVRHSAYFLIGLLVASVVAVILKPLLDYGPRSQAGMNGVAITIIILSVTVLIDLTQAAFGLSLHGDD